MKLEKSAITSNSSGSKTPAEHYEAGHAHRQAGRSLEAQGCCEQALAMDSYHADSLHLMGLLSLDAKQHDHAVEWFSRAIRRDPKPLYLTSLGAALLAQARFNEAVQVFDKAVQLKPDDADLWKNLGHALSEAGRPADAALTFQQALKLNPHHVEAALKSGFLLLELERYEEAIKLFDLYGELQPDHADVLQARAIAQHGLAVSLCDVAISLHEQKRFEEALTVSRRAYALDPANADACNVIGVSLLFLGRNEEALRWLEKALELHPGFYLALKYKARVLRELRRFDEAIATYHGTKAPDSDRFAVERGIEHIHLLTGNFEAGWAKRRAQWKAQIRPVYYPNFNQPLWLGEEPIAGKRLLIYADEGLGDTIHFARYVPMLAALGADIILTVDEPLHPLLSALPGVSLCLAKSVFAETWPAFDLHSPICALPLVFPTSLDAIPSATPYLPSPEQSRVRAWKDRLGPRDKLRIGLAWSGNPAHDNDHNRSIPLRMFSDLLDIDATFVSLNKGPNESDEPALRASRIVDLTAQLTDFAETAALVSCLDLVITVDTSVAHLAGALARPTWILLPYTPDYRWLLEGDVSPWYPTVKLFRQNESRDY
ncbi:MAG: tetratricopeptide repeat protein, partial [Bradyrhizobium sp.]|nr:tetratricopeptide repeat protein [Bradyrhizobium sp.]